MSRPVPEGPAGKVMYGMICELIGTTRTRTWKNRGRAFFRQYSLRLDKQCKLPSHWTTRMSNASGSRRPLFRSLIRLGRGLPFWNQKEMLSWENIRSPSSTRVDSPGLRGAPGVSRFEVRKSSAAPSAVPCRNTFKCARNLPGKGRAGNANLIVGPCQSSMA